MNQIDEKLSSISEQVKKGVAPQKETVRSLLSWVGVGRRGSHVVRRIRSALKRHGLATSPDFEWAYPTALISFVRAPESETAALGDFDPTYRIGHLESADRMPVCVTPNASLQEVVTLMMTNDFSQIPVLSGPREIKGVVSWKSIGMRLALLKTGQIAQDLMHVPIIVTRDEPMFSAISVIAMHDYVLVQGQDKALCGIVTASDLNEKFLNLAEPFLLIGEIENGLRKLMHGKFTVSDLGSVRAAGDDSRGIESPADLTIGEHLRLLENPANWEKLKVRIDRSVFIKQLHRVREIRNDVMHFDPDDLEDAELRFIREFAQFMKRLREVGAT